MLYFVVTIIAIWILFVIWLMLKKKKKPKKGERPLFRTEDDLEEYGKPLDKHPVDFDDAE